MEIPTKQNPIKKIIIYFLIIFGVIITGTYIFQLEVEKEEKTEEKEIDKKEKIVCLDTNLPEKFQTEIEKLEVDMEVGYKGEECSVIIERNTKDISEYERMWTEMFALVTKYNSELKNISSENLEQAVKEGKFEEKELIWDSETEKFLKTRFEMGVGYPKYTQERIKEKVMDEESIAIVPFEKVKPEYKVVSVSDRTPLDEDINELAYRLSDSFYISEGENSVREKVKKQLEENLSKGKYKPEKISNIVITGTSKIGTGEQHSVLKEKGHEHILGSVADILKEADIAHISNKTSILQNCPQEDSNNLCSPIETIELLNYANIDIVGMTGNHIVDYGGEEFRNTLDLYTENDIKYFGAGRTLQDAHRPRILELGNIKIAFLGYTNTPPEIYWSNENRGGNTTISESILERDIARAKENADYIFVEMHLEEQQEEYAKTAIDQGADIVTGVYSKNKGDIEYYEDGIIFYELGNFLASQDNGMIINHIFYKDNYLVYNVVDTYVSDNIQVSIE